MKKVGIYVFGLLVMALVFKGCGKEGEVGDDNPKDPNEKVFRAGAAIVDATGTVPSGFTVHDRLHARALVLDDGRNRLAFVIVDRTIVPGEVFNEAKRLIAAECKIPPMNVMMAPTHTHSQTPVDFTGKSAKGFHLLLSYPNRSLQPHQVVVARQMADAVKNAVANLEPAKIGWGAGSVPKWAHNRRWIMKNPVKNPLGGWEDVIYHPGRNDTNRDRESGPVDPGVPFISIQALDGRPISILANFSIHHAGDKGGVPENHISADYWALFATKITELIGAKNQSRPFVGIMSNGTSGDISSYDYSYDVPEPANGPYVRMQNVANDVAAEVHRVYQTVQYHNWVPLHAVQSELMLKRRYISPETLQYAQDMYAGNLPPWLPWREKLQAEMVLQLVEEWPENIPVLLQTFKIGEVGICAAPFELFAETGLDIKARSPFETTFTLGIANGTYGYLPTPYQHELGGYETWPGSPGKVEINGSLLIADRLLTMLNTLKRVSDD